MSASQAAFIFSVLPLEMLKSPLLQLIHTVPLPNFKTLCPLEKVHLIIVPGSLQRPVGTLVQGWVHDSQCAAVGSNRTHLVGVVVGIERVRMCGQCLE